MDYQHLMLLPNSMLITSDSQLPMQWDSMVITPLAALCPVRRRRLAAGG
jgi:hypothetical protein